MSFKASEHIANFCFPVPSVLWESKLVPFQAGSFSTTLPKQLRMIFIACRQSMLRRSGVKQATHVPLGPFTSASKFAEYCTSWQPDTSKVLFVIIDKASGTEKIAGFIACVNTAASDLITGIGAVRLPTHACELPCQFTSAQP